MKHAETVTFGGSGLDRAAQLRGDTDALAALWAAPGARILPIWRGKPLVEVDHPAIGWLPTDTPLVRENFDGSVFLGLEGTDGRFAVDISAWQPDEVPEALNSFLDSTVQAHPDLPETLHFAELRGLMAQLTPRDAELAATAKAILGWHRSHRFCARCGSRSELSMAGWQSTCPDCGAHHFPRTDPVVIMLITRGNSVLLGRSPGWPDGMYSLLAGFVEPGETIEAAVRREVQEESGVRVGPVSYLASQPWPFPASLMIGCHGEAETDEITIDPEEIEDAKWVTREKLMAVMAGEDTSMLPARRGAIAQFLLVNWLADSLD